MMKVQTVRSVVLTAAAACALATHGEIDWAEARIMGTTAGGKMFYAPGEEMNFTLKLDNVKGELPSDTYFIEWTRTGDDGKKDGGRVPASLAEPLVRYQKPDGLIQTHLSRLGDVFFKGAWMNCMVYSASALEEVADMLGEKE